MLQQRDEIKIRLIQTIDEYRAVEQLQREVWGLADAELVPDHVLLTAQKNGGLVLGAFDGDQLVGVVFGFLGLTGGGKLKHCSHIAGVAPAYQNRDIGYRLKLAQREHVLAQGIDLITWTFDPLESRNAYFNFHKLGVVCNTYLRNLYGDMRDRLNAGLPSDRFQVEWYIASQRVIRRLRGESVGPTRAALRAALRAASQAASQAALQEDTLPLAGDRLLIQIPANFQAIKSADANAARAWRERTRALFEAAFTQGYTAIDLLHEAGQSFYLLQKDWKPDED